MIEGNAGDAVGLHFSVLDGGGNPITGILDGGFTKRLYKRGVSDAATVTVTELGSGDYLATFTPDEAGLWNLVVRYTAGAQEFIEDIGVGLNAHARMAAVSAQAGSNTVFFHAFLLRNNRQVADSSNATITAYDDTGTVIGTITVATPDAEGFFTGTIIASPGLVNNRTYGVIVSIDDPAGTVVSAESVIRVSA